MCKEIKKEKKLKYGTHGSPGTFSRDKQFIKWLKMHSNKKISHTDTNQLNPQSENPFLGIKKCL